MNQQRMQAQQQRGGASGTKVTQGCALANVSSPGALSSPPPGGAMVMEDAEAQSPPAKRVKMESAKATPILHPPHTQHNTAVAPGKSEGSSVTCSKQQHTSPLAQQVVKSGTQTAVKVENAVNPSWSSQGTQQMKLNGPQKEQGPVKLEGGGPVKEEFQSAAIVQTGPDGGGPGVVTTPVKPEPANVGNSVLSSTIGTTSKSGKPKNLGTSLTELFTPQQIREHIIGLRQWVGQVQSCISVPYLLLIAEIYFLYQSSNVVWVDCDKLSPQVFD
jgi:E1A/CREB-binding protein